MSDLSVTGRFHIIKPPVQRQSNGQAINTREVIIAIPGHNNGKEQFVTFGEFGNKSSHIEQMRVGQPVTIFFNVRGTLYNDRTTQEPKTFNNLNIWKVEVQQGGYQQQQPSAPADQHQQGQQRDMSADVPPNAFEAPPAMPSYEQDMEDNIPF